MMDPELRNALNQTVYVSAPVGSPSASGAQVYGEAVARAARVEVSRRYMRGSDGENITTSHRMFTESSVGLQDRIWLPGEYVAPGDPKRARRPVSVTEHRDEDGEIHHYEVSL